MAQWLILLLLRLGVQLGSQDPRKNGRTELTPQVGFWPSHTWCYMTSSHVHLHNKYIEKFFLINFHDNIELWFAHSFYFGHLFCLSTRLLILYNSAPGFPRAQSARVCIFCSSSHHIWVHFVGMSYKHSVLCSQSKRKLHIGPYDTIHLFVPLSSRRKIYLSLIHSFCCPFL